MLRLLLKSKNMTLYKLEKESGLPHSTLSDIYHEKVDIDKVSVHVLKKIAETLDMSMDKLYDILSYNDLSLIACDLDFDLYKSNVCHEVKRLTYEKFVDMYSDDESIQQMYQERNTAKTVYLVSMLDHLCVTLNKPKLESLEEIRNTKFTKLIVPESVYYLLLDKEMKVEDIYKEALPEFIKHNIAEAEIDEVN